MKLHELIQQRREEITRRWRLRVLGAQAPESTRRAELVNSLPMFLDELSAALARAAGEPANSPLPERSPTAQEHGRQRFRTGFSIDAMVLEYGALRDVILELSGEEQVQLSLHEIRLFADLISTGIAEAVRRFSSERDEELRLKANEHFAFLAHELRNPLQSAKLAMGLLAQGGSSRALQTLSRSLQRISDQLDHVLEASRAQASLRVPGALALEHISLSALVRDAIEETALDAAHKRIRIELSCAADLSVDADPRLLRSAVTNLLRNAIKFTHDGGAVLLRCQLREQVVGIEVEDECGGLPPGTLERLFTPFVQTGTDRSGFGLGLSIARQAVTAHGGSLQAHDLPGRGCVFMISLPAPRP